jgi:nicotinate phosphoribosyltransferase
MGVSADAPALDMVYKLTQYAGSGRIKLSAGKAVLPGPKQIFREEANGTTMRDVIACASEERPGQALLAPVMQHGRRLLAEMVTLEHAREYAAKQLARLPPGVRGLAAANPPYPVEVSAELTGLNRDLAGEVAAGDRMEGNRT